VNIQATASDTHTIASGTHTIVSDSHTIISDMRDDVSKIREEIGSQVRQVRAKPIQSVENRGMLTVF
jgi:hypothetical protein